MRPSHVDTEYATLNHEITQTLLVPKHSENIPPHNSTLEPRLRMAPSTTVLITGCKSGIGKALLAAYVARDNTLAIAAIRDGPNTGAARALEALPTGSNSKVVVVKYDASSESSVKEMASYLQSEHNVTSLDVVVANAGILKQWGPVRTVKSEDILEHFTIHTLATIQLYQATAPLLDNSQQTPKFFIISSSLGSNSLMDATRQCK